MKVKSYQQSVGKGAYGIKEIPLHTTPKEIKPVSNCSGLFAREGGRRRVREGEIAEAAGALRRGSSARSPRQLRASRSCRLGEPTTRRDAFWCGPCLGSSLTCPSRHSPPPSPHRPCRFFAAFVLRPNALAAGQGCAMGSSRPTPGGDVLESKRFGGTTERAKRRFRQTELGRADTRTRGSVGVVGVGVALYATRRFGQARQAKRSLLSTRESRNDHRSVRVGRCVGRPDSVCASIGFLQERWG